MQKPQNRQTSRKPSRSPEQQGADAVSRRLLATLVERVAACQGSDAYFTASEMAAWPADFARAVNALRLLSAASPAQSTECTGCEEACLMPVEVLPGPEPRALIFCDKRDDISRVDVVFASLERRKSSGQLLAEALAKLLGMTTAPQKIDATRWQVGQFQGTKHKSPLALALDLEPVLALAGHTVKLAEVLNVKKGVAAIDLPALRKLVDNPRGRQAETDEPAHERADRIRKRIAEIKAQGVKAFRAQVAAEEGVDASRIGQLLREYPEQKLSSNWHPGTGKAGAHAPARKKKT